ncbi:hypothetical protein PENTCL1PPCAC_16119, partial [Pristionchus entomophagus]
RLGHLESSISNCHRFRHRPFIDAEKIDDNWPTKVHGLRESGVEFLGSQLFHQSRVTDHALAGISPCRECIFLLQKQLKRASHHPNILGPFVVEHLLETNRLSTLRNLNDPRFLRHRPSGFGIHDRRENHHFMPGVNKHISETSEKVYVRFGESGRVNEILVGIDAVCEEEKRKEKPHSYA